MSEHDAGDDSERSGGTSSLRAQRLTNRVYGSSDSSKKGARRAFPGEAAFRRLVEEARYELEVDPYRGLLRYGSGGASSSDTVNPPLHPLQQLSPWEVTCRWGVPLPVSSGNAEGDAGSPAQQQKQQQQQSPESTLVQMVCQNECPCLTRWTETQQASRKKTQRKGKANEAPALGGRPASAERCRCDYNPFCLATLGGAMDQVLQRRLEVLVGEKSQETDVSSVAPTKYGEDYNDEVLVEEDDGDCNEMAVTETAIPKKAKPSALTISSPSATSSSSYMVDLQDSGDESTPILQPKGGLSTDQRKPLEETIYTQRTWARLRKLRQSTCVERDRIRDYLATTLQDLTVTLSVETCVERIAQWHNKLIFQNPCFMEADRPDMIRLAIPPGIENLGATCYLNTQLQCLAQVTVFLDGILSWRAPLLQTEDDRMTKVLALFQQICTNLYAGTQSTITTLEFSNELGLDFHEQQDPNEFSKLFFDHVHTAFQKEASDKPGGLSELLPHLFQGILQHQTICQTCGSKSQRSEEFMDLHLPIVKRSDDCHIRRKGQQSIMDSLGSMFSNKDTDVQYLLNRYLQDEMLEGDNQYYCDNCGGKQDACRRVVFQKLPPLLNLPLNRYVYDMKSASKKKLLEKVLLPLDLRIELTEKDSGSNSEHRYVLCAAMLHRGKSAHSGHYVAEAMDWCTGRWFEFNDSAVKILDDGPSSSFDQNAKSTLYGLKKNTEGSQDAYNLFYVEETFLAQSIFDRMQGLARKEAFSSVTDEKNIVRTQLYTDLRE
jgi:ubiquitin carboxyl-terminal hydrolase 48